METTSNGGQAHSTITPSSLLLLEVELMETSFTDTQSLENRVFNIASIIGSGINGNFVTSRKPQAP